MSEVNRLNLFKLILKFKEIFLFLHTINQLFIVSKRVRFRIFFGVFFLITVVSGQQKTDSLLNFFNYKPELKKYEPDFQKKIKNDSTLYFALDSLKNIGYYTLSVDSVRNNDVWLNKGKLYKQLWVKNDTLFNQKTDWFPVRNLDSLIQKVNQKYAEKGYPFIELKIIPMGYKDGEARLRLEPQLFDRRTVDGIRVSGYEKLSKGYIRHALGLKTGATYNESELYKISERMSYSPFIEEVRPAQTLFNPDSTYIYLYVNKVKSNIFDGIIGFGNDEKGDFQLNGNVKIELNNNFNAMEQIRLNWIATADKSSTLDLNVRIPYLFKSAIGTQTSLNMFKRDSTFVNTKLEERLFYQITMNSNLGLNLSYENSNFVLDDHPEMAQLYDDYSKSGYGLSYEFVQPIQNRLFEGKSKVFLIGKTLNRKITEYDPEINEYLDDKSRQYEIGLDAFRLFRLHPHHYIKARIQGYGLFGNDDHYSTNELYRIGGFNSLRGFNEESITASAYGITSLEYRFLPNDGFYISVFGDYGFVENKASDLSQNLFGTGVGFSFLTQLGIFNMSYAVGKQSNTGFDFRNSKIHFGILTRF